MQDNPVLAASRRVEAPFPASIARTCECVCGPIYRVAVDKSCTSTFRIIYGGITTGAGFRPLAESLLIFPKGPFILSLASLSLPLCLVGRSALQAGRPVVSLIDRFVGDFGGVYLPSRRGGRAF